MGKKTKLVRATVRIKSTSKKPLPDFGLGPGVLGFVDLEVPKDKLWAAAALGEFLPEIIEKFVEIEFATLRTKGKEG